MLLYREAAGESVALFHREEGDSFLRKRTEHHPSLFRKSRLLFYKEERVSLSLHRRIKLLPYVLILFEEERVSPFSIYKGGRLLLYEQARVYFSSIARRQTPSLCKGKSVSLYFLKKKKADSLSTKRRECLSVSFGEEANSFSNKRKERPSSLYKGGRLLLYREEKVSLSVSLLQKRGRLLFDQKEKVSLSVLQKRDRLVLYGKKRVSIFFTYIEEADSFSMKRRERLSSL